MVMQVRDVVAPDAAGMRAVLLALRAAGRRTRPADIPFVRETYIAHPEQILCSVALGDDNAVLGFQSLKRAWDGNPYGVMPGWGIIGTHIHPDAARQGGGRALFIETVKAARAAGLIAIDASIGKDNAVAQAYYEAMGFRTYRETERTVCKAFTP